MPDRHSYIRLAIAAGIATAEAAIRGAWVWALGMGPAATAPAALSQIKQGRAVHARAKAVGPQRRTLDRPVVQ